MNSAIALIDSFIIAVPIRISHMVFPILFAMAYCLFTYGNNNLILYIVHNILTSNSIRSIVIVMQEFTMLTQALL